MSEAVTIHHDIGDIVLTPKINTNPSHLKAVLRSALDSYLAEDRISASQLHDEMRARHGDHYRSCGYYLRVYRQRADLTQERLAKAAGIQQHHISEIENNKRSLGKAKAKELALILDCDYRKLL